MQVPAGIKDDVYIKYAGKGDESLSGQSGDLYVQIRITPDKRFKRQGDDLHMDIEVSLFDLVLGAQIEVPHPAGSLKIKIPKGTQVSDQVRIANKGYGTGGGLLSSKGGSMIVHPKVHIPKKLSKKEEKLWKELQKA